MSRYIDTEHLMEKVSRMIEYCEKNKDKKFNALNVLFQVGDAIMDCPTADVVEVRHGKWIWKFNLDGDDFYECSICDRQEVINGLCREKNPSEHFPYRHCGAKMDGELKKKYTEETL